MCRSITYRNRSYCATRKHACSDYLCLLPQTLPSAQSACCQNKLSVVKVSSEFQANLRSSWLAGRNIRRNLIFNGLHGRDWRNTWLREILKNTLLREKSWNCHSTKDGFALSYAGFRVIESMPVWTNCTALTIFVRGQHGKSIYFRTVTVFIIISHYDRALKVCLCLPIDQLCNRLPRYLRISYEWN